MLLMPPVPSLCAGVGFGGDHARGLPGDVGIQSLEPSMDDQT